jgi:hypothetical protein
MFQGGLGLVFVGDTVFRNQGLCMSLRENLDSEFGPTLSFERKLNTAILSGPSLANDGRSLYFDSNRPGGQGGFDLWTSHRVRRNR